MIYGPGIGTGIGMGNGIGFRQKVFRQGNNSYLVPWTAIVRNEKITKVFR